MTDSDNEPPQLSAETFLALQEFYQEQEKRESDLLSGAAVQEDWVIEILNYWKNSGGDEIETQFLAFITFLIFLMFGFFKVFNNSLI